MQLQIRQTVNVATDQANCECNYRLGKLWM